jgi:chitinase
MKCIHKFHRLDIDYEYPDSAEQARGYVELLKELRQGLDAHARSKGIDYKYPLTVSQIDILQSHSVSVVT